MAEGISLDQFMSLPAKTAPAKGISIDDFMKLPAATPKTEEPKGWGEGFVQGAINTGSRAVSRLEQMGSQFMLEQTAGRARDRDMTFDQILQEEQTSSGMKDMQGKPLKTNTGMEYVSAAARWIDANYANLIGTDDKAAADAYAKSMQQHMDEAAATPKSAIARDFEKKAIVKDATFGQTLANFGSAILKNPVGAFSWALETAGENAPQMAVAAGATLLTKKPAVGIGLMGGGSYATERYTSPGDFFREKGLDLNKEKDRQRLLNDPAMMKDAANRGIVRGLVIGAFDALSGGIAGQKLLANPFAEVVAQTLTQGILGAGGETVGRLGAGQKLDWGDIASEFFAEMVSLPLDAITAGREMRANKTPPPPPAADAGAAADATAPPGAPPAGVPAGAAPADTVIPPEEPGVVPFTLVSEDQAPPDPTLQPSPSPTMVVNDPAYTTQNGEAFPAGDLDGQTVRVVERGPNMSVIETADGTKRKIGNTLLAEPKLPNAAPAEPAMAEPLRRIEAENQRYAEGRRSVAEAQRSNEETNRPNRLTPDDRASPISDDIIDAGKALVEDATGKPSTVTTTEVVDGERRVVDTPVATIVAKDRAETAALIGRITAGVSQPVIAPLGQQAGPLAGAADVAATPTPDAAAASVAAPVAAPGQSRLAPKTSDIASDVAAPSVAPSQVAREYPTAPRDEWYSDADYQARGGQITMMSPDEFLARAKPLDVDESSRDNIDDLKRHIESGRRLDPLKLYADGKEDGRHRAIAAKELGITQIPVIEFSTPKAQTPPSTTQADVSDDAHPRSEDTSSFEEFVAKSKAHIAAREAKAKEMADRGGSTRMEHQTREGQKALVGPDMAEPGKFRVTRFDKQGPFGHTTFNTLEEAANEALRDGYVEVAQPEVLSEPAKQKALKDKIAAKRGAAAPAQAPRPVTRPIRDDVATTATGRDVPVTYAVIEADDLIASQRDEGGANPAYPQELQPRDRSRGSSDQQINKIAQNLDPRLLDQNPNASDGAPIISEDGVVESGNGRVLAVRRAYGQGLPTAEKYRQYLADQGYPVDGMRQPVLVRVRKGELDDRAAFTREANERTTLAMSATERAMADATAMKPETVGLYRGGEIGDAGNRDFVRSFMQSVVNPNEQASMVTPQGSLSQEAVRRVQGALLGKAYGDADLVGSLIESPDTNIKAIGGALMDTAGLWSQKRTEAKEGTISPDVDITDHVLEAVRLVQRARNEGRPLAEYVSQKDIFSGETVSPQAEAVLRLMFRNDASWTQPVGREKLADALRFYATEARKTSSGVDLLGEKAPAPTQILAEAKRRQYGGETEAQAKLTLGNRTAGPDTGAYGGERAVEAKPGPQAESRPAVPRKDEAPAPAKLKPRKRAEYKPIPFEEGVHHPFLKSLNKLREFVTSLSDSEYANLSEKFGQSTQHMFPNMAGNAASEADVDKVLALWKGAAQAEPSPQEAMQAAIKADGEKRAAAAAKAKAKPAGLRRILLKVAAKRKSKFAVIPSETDEVLDRRYGKPGTQARTLEEARIAAAGQPTIVSREGLPDIEIRQPYYESFEAWVDGKKVGSLSISPQGPHASSVTVEPVAQRQGVATALYDAAEAALGRPMTPSPMGMSGDAIGFWKNRFAGVSPEEKQAILQEALDKGIEQKIGKSARSRVDALGYKEPPPKGKIVVFPGLKERIQRKLDGHIGPLWDIVYAFKVPEKYGSIAAVLAKAASIPKTDSNHSVYAKFGQYASDEWWSRRVYNFGTVKEPIDVRGLEEAVPLLVERARNLAVDELNEDRAKKGQPLLKRFVPARDRKATIAIGPPAAGKSGIANAIALLWKAAIVDVDDAKKVIPEYYDPETGDGGIGATAVHEESSLMGTEVLKRLMANGDNIVIPKIGGDPTKMEKLRADLQAQGYTVDIVLMDVEPKTSLTRMLKRFARTGRLIDPAYFIGVAGEPALSYVALKEGGNFDGYSRVISRDDGNRARVSEAFGREPALALGQELERDGTIVSDGRYASRTAAPDTPRQKVTGPVARDAEEGITREPVQGGFIQYQLRPEFKAKAEALLADLQPLLNRLAPGVPLRAFETIRALINGQNLAVAGQYLNGMIDVALEAADPRSVLHHEAIHALWNVFTDKEKAILERMAEKKGWITNEIKQAYPEEFWVEEGIAHAMARWHEGARMDGVIAKAFKKFMAVARILGSVFTKHGIRSAEDVFADVASGKIGQRLAQSQTYRRVESQARDEGGRFTESLFQQKAFPTETVDMFGGKREQLVIPGAEKSTAAQLAQMKADAPLKAKRNQEFDLGELPLFGDQKKQMSLFQIAHTGTRSPRDKLSAAFNKKGSMKYGAGMYFTGDRSEAEHFARGGYVYDVDIPDNDEIMNWDKPMDTFSKGVQAKLEKLFKEEGSRPPDREQRSYYNLTSKDWEEINKATKEAEAKGGDREAIQKATTEKYSEMSRAGERVIKITPPTGADIYDWLMDRMPGEDGTQNMRDASQRLADAGIPGHRYMEENYDGIVIYDDNRVEIKAVNGKPVEGKEKQQALTETESLPQARFQLVWHGTPHQVDRLTTSKIGTGEGFQAFGWGLYFAQLKDIGAEYRKTLVEKHKLGPGELLGVDIPENKDMLKWEETLDQQPAAVQKAFADLGIAKPSANIPADLKKLIDDAGPEYGDDSVRRELFNPFYNKAITKWADDNGIVPHPNYDLVNIAADLAVGYIDSKTSRVGKKPGGVDSFTGGRAYRALSNKLGSDRAASEALRDRGVPGHMFHDQGSRAFVGEAMSMHEAKWRLQDRIEWHKNPANTEAQDMKDFYLNNAKRRVAKFDNATHNFVVYDDAAMQIQSRFALIAPPTTPPTTPAFKRWFSGSKVVDAKGEPLVVYHHGGFDENSDIPRGGMHFGTKDAATERAFVKGQDDAAGAVTAYKQDDGKWYWVDDMGMDSAESDYPGHSTEQAAIKAGRAEVLRLLEDGVYDQELEDLGNLTAAYLSIKNPKRVTDLGEGVDHMAKWDAAIAKAKAEGHDGIVYRNRFEDKGKDSYIAFEPTQIKSVNNRGTFDPSNSDIRFALTQAPHTPKQVQQTMQGFLNRGQPIDRAIRLPLQLLGGIDEQGRWRPGRRLSDKLGPQRREGGAIGAVAGSLVGGIFGGPVGAVIGAPIGATVGGLILGSAPAPANGRFPWLSGIAENAKRGLISNYGLDPEYVEAYRKSDLGKTAILRQAAGIMKVLHNAGVSTVEAKVLQSILTGTPVNDAEMTRLAEPIRKAIDDLGAEAVSLGLISAESFERNRGAYLHRVYQKHEAIDDGSLAGWVSKAMAKRRKRIIGDQLKGRGLFWEVPVERLMQDAPNRGVPGKGDKWRVLDRTSADGKVSRRVYVPADKPTPVEFTFPGWVDRGEWEVRQVQGVTPAGSAKKMGPQAATGVTLWRDYTEAERSKMGEIVDARYTIAKTFMLMANDLSTGRFYREVSQKAEWTSDTEPTSPWKEAGEYSNLKNRFWTNTEIQWVKVPDTAIANTGGKKKWGALSGKWIRAEIWRDLNEIDIANTPGTWRKLYAQWKKNKTARNPVVHMNNIMSNVMFMDMADIRTQDLVGGINAYFRGTKDFEEATENGAFGSDIVSQELRDNVLKPILDEIAKQSTGGTTLIPFFAKAGVVGIVADKLWTWAKTVDNGMLRAYQMEDEIFRMAAYMRRRSQGATPAEAGREARDQFLNYDIRAPWVLAMRNTMLPFISYTYRAVPKLAENIMHRPWKVAKYATIAYAVNALSYMLDEGDDDDDEDKKGRLVNREQMERAGLRDEEQGYTWLGSPRMVRMPWRDEHGMPVFLDVRRWIPAGDIFDSAPGSAALPIPAPLQFGGPLQLAFELNLNKQAFTGENITNELTDTPFEKVSDVADWAWKSWAPASFWTPRSWYWTKIANALYGAKDAGGNVYSLPQAVLSSFGIKVKPLDVENGVMWHYKDFKKEQISLKAELRAAARQLDRGMISQSTFDKQAASIMRKFENLGVRVDDLGQRTKPQREPVE